MHKPLIQIFIVLLLIIKLTSCITTRQTNYLQTPTASKAKFKDSVNYMDYKLKEGDRLYIQVYSTDAKTSALFNGSTNGGTGMQQLSMNAGNGGYSDLYTYLVEPDGSIQFPIVGKIMVMGKTLREAKYEVQNAIKPILKLNSVDVRLTSKTFSIIGAGKAGRFPIPREKINIYEALAIAGDFGTFADRSKVRILRQTANGAKITSFDIRNQNIINSEYYYIEPDDIIFLQPLDSKFFGITSLWMGLSTILTTISFGAGIYGLLTR